MQKKVFPLIVILVAAAVLTACAGVAAAQGPTPAPAAPASEPRTISVTGSGKAYLTPDIAYVNIGVHSEGKEATEAVASNNSQTQKVTDALKKAGIDAKDIQTTNFSIYPQQRYDQAGQPTGEITYMVDNSVYVTVRDLSKVGSLLDTVVKAGANAINGIQFDVADKTAALSDARAAAVKNASVIAGELAQAAGVQVGQVRSVSAAVSNYPVPVYEGKGGAAMQAGDASVPVSPGQMIITVEVNVTYDIR